MGLFDRFRPTRQKPSEEHQYSENKKPTIEVGANPDNDTNVQTYDNSNITFSGSLQGYNYDSILRDKQKNIVDLYKLQDYYCDADSIIRGAIKQTYVPYATCSPWMLTGTNAKTIKLYEAQYKKMRLDEKMEGIALEYFKYANVFCYLLDGQLITLPPHKCRIGNVTLNGRPIVDYDCQSILNEWKTKSYDVEEKAFKDSLIEKAYAGYPKEIIDAIKKGHQYAQLDPENTYVLQAPKESWQRYAVPIISACLYPLATKELLRKYETSIVNLGIHSYVHVRYGDEKKGADMLPSGDQLGAVRGVVSKGMSGFPLVVTNQLAKSEVVQPDLEDLFQYPMYDGVNTDILSACGIGGILINGTSENGSTFASAQISTTTVLARIEAFRREFCEMMNRINERLVDVIDGTYNKKEVPEFAFMPLDIGGKKALQDACRNLWNDGLMSMRTMMKMNGYNLDAERNFRKEEQSDGTEDIMIPRNQKQNVGTQQNDGNDKAGRKKLDDSERTSDPDSAMRGKAPKPSNPEGSMDDESS